METKQERLITADELEIFICLQLDIDVDGLFEEIINNGGWVLKAIEKRFEAHKIEVDKKVMIAILTMGDCAVGKCAKLVDYVADWCNKFDYKKIDWAIFTHKIYPF